MEIEKYLLDKGVKPNYRGFYQLSYAIELCLNDKNYLQYFTKRLYPDVAKDMQITQIKVERDIRTALRNSNINDTISEFISRATLEIQINRAKKRRVRVWL